VEDDRSRQKDPLFTQLYSKEVSLLGLAIVVAQYRLIILTTTLCAALGGLLLALILPNHYTAVTSILPPQQGSSSSGSAIMSQLSSLSSLAGVSSGGPLKNPNDMQVALMRSRTVEDAVIDRFKLGQLYKTKRPSETRKKVEKLVDIDSGTKDGIIRISVTDTDSNRAADIANGYVEEFQRFSARLAVTEASQRRLFFENQLAQAKEALADAEEDLKKTEQETGVIQVDAQMRTAIESVAQLRAQIAAKQVQIRGLRSFGTEQNPEVAQAEQQLSQLEAEQNKLGVSSDGTSDGLLIQKSAMQEAGLKYVRKLREVRYRQTIFDLLARQYEAAKVDEARQGATVQVVDKAIPPDQKSSPKIGLMTIVATFLGLILGLAYAFTVEGYRRLARNPYEQWRLERLRSLFVTEKNE
jgi:tyrosine-protein kinase Etk/Wzc